MIRVTLELVSARGAARDRLLGVAYIANTGQQTLLPNAAGAAIDYKVWLSKTIEGRTAEAWKTGRAAISHDDIDLLNGPADGDIVAFNNVKRGAWDLLYLALKAIVGDRNPCR